jgi:hypothetical protein
MDIQEKIQFWKNEVERAKQNDFYFDTQSMLEVIETVEEQQKEIEAIQETSIINGNLVVKYEEALRHIKNCYPVPAENTDLIPIEVLYEIQLIVHKVLED